MSLPKVGIGVIVIRDNKVLIGKRKSAHGCDTWQFPGGHLEHAESPESCARRELLEETGLTVEKFVTGPYTNDIFEKENKHYITLYALGVSEHGEPTACEPEKCSEWRWCEWEKLPTPLFLPISNLLKSGFSIAKDYPELFKQ